MSKSNLKELSDQATPGPWHEDWFPFWDCESGEQQKPMCEGICTHDEDAGLADSIATCSEREAKFIVALVNAYRSGQLHDATALAEARAEGRRQGLEWQPIETAPNDEGPILVCDNRLSGGFHQVVSWEPDPRAPGYSWATSDGIGFHETAFTHWMPLPNSPALATAPAETQKPETGESR